MPIKPKVNEMPVREPVPAGSYPARLYSIIHIGSVKTETMGKTKEVDKVRLTFELPTKKEVFNEEKGEQPYSVSTEFTLSMYESAYLRKFIEGWVGKKLTEEEAINTDIEEYIGKEGLVNIVHSEKNGNVYANIASISALPDGMICPKQINPSFILNYNDKWDLEVFEKLPNFLKEKMSKTPEYEMATRGEASAENISAVMTGKKTELPKNETDEINLDDIEF